MITEAEKKLLVVILLKGVPLILLAGLLFFLCSLLVRSLFDYDIPTVFLAALMAVVVGLFSEKHIKPYIQKQKRG